MNLKEAASSQTATVHAEDGVTIQQFTDEGHRAWLQRAGSHWKAVISEDEMYDGKRARGPGIEERRLVR